MASLSAGDAGMLLDTAVDRLDRKVGQRQTLVTWIRAVLLKHTAFLMSSGGADTTTPVHGRVPYRMQGGRSTKSKEQFFQTGDPILAARCTAFYLCLCTGTDGLTAALSSLNLHGNILGPCK